MPRMVQIATEPVSDAKVLGAPLGARDVLGRKIGSFESEAEPVAIKRNSFQYKSLSSWAVNIAVGCSHGCRFCYVPAALRMGSAKGIRTHTGATIPPPFTAAQVAEDGIGLVDALKINARAIDHEVLRLLEPAALNSLHSWPGSPVRPSRQLLLGIVEALNSFVAAGGANKEAPAVAETTLRTAYANLIRPANTGLRDRLREHGILDPDLDWGTYVLLRPWVPSAFRKSLRIAASIKTSELNRDGNRAVMYSTTTDPFQHFGGKENGWPAENLRLQAETIMVESLRMIREESELRVRILTRGQPTDKVWDEMQAFNESARLLFGVSLPTTNDRWRRIYEPHAPPIASRIKALEEAVRRGIPLYIAVAPTYPECDEDDVRATLARIKPLNPITVFTEPINLRAENVARMEAHAKRLGHSFPKEVFDADNWPSYAVKQLALVQTIAREQGLLERLHPWPDSSLLSTASWDRVVRDISPRPGDSAFEAYQSWIRSCHSRVSEWPKPPKTKKLK